MHMRIHAQGRSCTGNIMHMHYHAHVRHAQVRSCTGTFTGRYVHAEVVNAQVLSCICTFMHRDIHAQVRSCTYTFMHRYVHAQVHSYRGMFMHRNIHAQEHPCSFDFFRTLLADQRISLLCQRISASGRAPLEDQRISVQRTKKKISGLANSGLNKKLAMPSSGIVYARSISVPCLLKGYVQNKFIPRKNLDQQISHTAD